MKRNLYTLGLHHRPTLDDLFCDKRAVCKEGDQESLSVSSLVNCKEIRSGKRLAACQGEIQAACLVDLVKDSEDFGSGKLLSNALRCIEAIRVAHHAFEIAPAGQFPLTQEGEAFSRKLREEGRTKNLQGLLWQEREPHAVNYTDGSIDCQAA